MNRKGRRLVWILLIGVVLTAATGLTLFALRSGISLAMSPTELLAAQPNQPMTLPAIVFFDKNFNITHRYFEYIPPKKMLSILKNK